MLTRLKPILPNIKTVDLNECARCGQYNALPGLTLCEYCHKYYGIETNVPLGYQPLTYDKFVVNNANKRAYEVSRAFFTDKISGAYIFGNVGCGKTHLLIATLIEGLKQYKYCRYYNIPSILHIQREEYETQEEAELRVVEKLLLPKYLFLDDLLAEKLGEKARSFLYLLLNRIIENGSPKVFITSNAPLSSIMINVDDRVASRIAGLVGKNGIAKNIDSDYRTK